MIQAVEDARGRGARTRAGQLLIRRAVWSAFAWGFAEATLFFLLPDIVVGGVALLSWRRGLRAAGAAVAGAVVGGACLFAATRLWPGTIRTTLDALPAIPERFFTRVHGSVAENGGWAVLVGPSQGVPYKLYAYEWARSGHSVLSLIAWTVPARAIRILGTGLVAALAGTLVRRWLGARSEPVLLAAYAVCWCALYSVYFSRVGLY